MTVRFLDHDFYIRSDYPNETPNGKLFAGHYYKCRACGLEVGHPDHLEDLRCPSA